MMRYNYMIRTTTVKYYQLLRVHMCCNIIVKGIYRNSEHTGRIKPPTSHKISGLTPTKNKITPKWIISQLLDFDRQIDYIGVVALLSQIWPYFWARPTPLLSFWLFLMKA